MVKWKYLKIYFRISAIPILMVLLSSTSSTSSTALSVTTNSCHWQDVANAVKQVEAAGGGTVYIKEGECDWSDSKTIIINNNTVNGKGNVSIIGAGIDKTIIKNVSSSTEAVFKHKGRNTKPIRFSGMTLDNCDGLYNIYIIDAVDFRVDHIKFIRTKNKAVFSLRSSPGLVDNCEFIDSELGNAGMTFYWSKRTGIGREGDCLPWPERNFGTDDAVFVEDNTFQRFRQPTSGYDGAHFVFRYNTIIGCYSDTLDVHGPYGWGDCKNSGRTQEVYHNTYIRKQEDIDAGFPLNIAVSARGGAGVVFNNTAIGSGIKGLELTLENTYGHSTAYYNFKKVHPEFIEDNPDIDYVGCDKCEQGKKKYQQPSGWWAWNNDWSQDAMDFKVNIASWGGCGDSYEHPAVGESCIKPDEDYFLREPTMEQDGFIYEPYEYPHPLRSYVPPDDEPAPPDDEPIPPDNGEEENPESEGGDVTWISPAVIDACAKDQADALIDGDTSTIWNHWTKETHWVVLDLGKEYTIEKVRKYHKQYSTEYAVAGVYVSNSTSDDNWGTSLGTLEMLNNEASGWQEIDLTSGKRGRYIKILSESSSSTYWREIEIGVSKKALNEPKGLRVTDFTQIYQVITYAHFTH